MKVSILLPAHNRADVIGWSIRSILAQTVPDWELLVVGDGCVDATAEVVASFGDSRIRWFDLPKGPGVGYANRNIALREAVGEFIAYACHDDLWLNDHLARLLELIETTGADLVYSRPLFVEPGGRIIPVDFDLREANTLAAFLEFRMCGIASSCVLHRRNCFQKVGYWDDTLANYADWEMWIRIVRASDRPPAYCPTSTCLHFRAIWRTQSNVISRFGALPFSPALFPALQLPPPPSDQENAWRKLESSADEWVRAVRSAIGEADQYVVVVEQALIDAFHLAAMQFVALKDYLVCAENDDPQFFLPPCDFKKSRRVLLRVEITCSKATMLQIFYRTESEPDYSEKQSVCRNLHAGLNTLYISLAADGLGSVLRIDPASHSGEYLIHSLEVRGDEGDHIEVAPFVPRS